jgi:hypothetical protein
MAEHSRPFREERWKVPAIIAGFRILDRRVTRRQSFLLPERWA